MTCYENWGILIVSNLVEAISFDAAGTLLFPKPSVGVIYQEVLAAHELVLDCHQLEQAFQASFKKVKKDPSIPEPGIRERAYWKTVVAESILRLTSLPNNFETVFAALWQEFAKGSRWRLNEGVFDLFDFLDSRGTPFVLLTNWDARVRSVLIDHGLQDRFSHLFISCEIGSEKPDRGIFDFAASSLSIKPRNILHVGDHFNQDVLGARNAGWMAAHFACANESTTEDANTVSRLGELCDRFEFA